MILKTKGEIFKWLKNNDAFFKKNIDKNAYELIDIYNNINQILFNEMINKDNIPNEYFENLKKEGHQYILNVSENVDISDKNLLEIPISFYEIKKNFYCGFNKLKTLKGSPVIVIEDFVCKNNKLVSLEYSPRYIGGTFDCNNNKIVDFKYFPDHVVKCFCCNDNYELLKYKVKNDGISAYDFLEMDDFLFWKQFHQQEKANEENEQILKKLDIQKSKVHHILKKI